MWGNFFQDQPSYDEFMQHVRDTLNEENPEEDADLIIEALDELADMQPGNQYSRPIIWWAATTTNSLQSDCQWKDLFSSPGYILTVFAVVIVKNIILCTIFRLTESL